MSQTSQLACIAEDHSLAVTMSAEQLRDLFETLSDLISRGEQLQETISAIAGPVPSPLPAHLITMLNFGTGHYRHCRDTLAALYRRANSLKKTNQKSQ